MPSQDPLFYVCMNTCNILNSFLDLLFQFCLQKHSNVSFFQPPALDLRHGELLGYYIGYKATNSAEPFRYHTLEVNATTAAIVDFASLVRVYTAISTLSRDMRKLSCPISGSKLNAAARWRVLLRSARVFRGCVNTTGHGK